MALYKCSHSLCLFLRRFSVLFCLFYTSYFRKYFPTAIFSEVFRRWLCHDRFWPQQSTSPFINRSTTILENRSTSVMRMRLSLCQHTAIRTLKSLPSLRRRLITTKVIWSADKATILLAVGQKISFMRASQWTLNYLRWNLMSRTRTTIERRTLSTVVLPWMTEDFSIHCLHLLRWYHSNYPKEWITLSNKRFNCNT